MHLHSLLPICAVTLTALASAQAPTKRVALCGAAAATNTVCQWTDVQTKLLATGQFAVVDIINVTSTGTGTPTLNQLLAYDALLCWTNTTPASNVAWGNVLADYVDAGGGVVVGVFANSTTTAGRNIDGRWQSGYEVILDRTGSTTGANGSLGTVSLPGHPVMAGVTSFTAGSAGSRPTGTALEVGSILIAQWNTGHVLVAQGANPRRIDLGFYPPSSVCGTVGWITGGDQLMTNALLFVSTGGRFIPTGTGCSGSSGVPALAAAPASRPALGTTFAMELTNLPLGFALLGLGFSDVTSGPFPLPLDLTIFGMPGCSLLIDPAVTLFLVGTGTSASRSIAIPFDPAMLGLNLFAQGFAIDPAANAAGLTVSNAGKAKVGF
jgi:hypothetical protein